METWPLISIVLPAYNEELNIRPLFERLRPILAQLSDRFRFEFVVTDNHSTDRTFAVLQEVAAGDPRVRVFRFSRNFGFQRSILTGYMQCRGDAAIQLDVDLQDPPELIPVFLDKWQAGADVVYGIRIKRSEGRVITFARSLFYRLIDLLSEDKLPVDAGDFRLISRRVIDIVCAYRDANPYLRGTIATLGFEQVGVSYARSARKFGESKFPFSKLLSRAGWHPQPLDRAAALRHLLRSRHLGAHARSHALLCLRSPHSESGLARRLHDTRSAHPLIDQH